MVIPFSVAVLSERLQQDQRKNKQKIKEKTMKKMEKIVRLLDRVSNACFFGALYYLVMMYCGYSLSKEHGIAFLLVILLMIMAEIISRTLNKGYLEFFGFIISFEDLFKKIPEWSPNKLKRNNILGNSFRAIKDIL
jgi:hypothetical protein